MTSLVPALAIWSNGHDRLLLIYSIPQAMSRLLNGPEYTQMKPSPWVTVMPPVSLQHLDIHSFTWCGKGWLRSPYFGIILNIDIVRASINLHTSNIGMKLDLPSRYCRSGELGTNCIYWGTKVYHSSRDNHSYKINIVRASVSCVWKITK